MKNETIRNLMDVKHTIVFDIIKQLLWCGSVQRMPDERITKEMLTWVPLVKRRRGRTRKSWRGGYIKN